MACKLTVYFSFWGFWAKKNNPDQTSYIDSLSELYRLLTEKNVASFYPANDDIMVVHHKDKDYQEAADGKTNVVLGI